MALEQQIMSELKAAMLAKDEAALRGLRAIKAAILLAKTADGKQGEISEDDEVKLLHPKFSDCFFCNLLALVYLTL